jgi:hypothetical protein
MTTIVGFLLIVKSGMIIPCRKNEEVPETRQQTGHKHLTISDQTTT